MDEMAFEAEDPGTNAVIGVDLDYETIHIAGRTMLIVTASGPAVRGNW